MEQIEHRDDAPFSGPITPELVLVSSPDDARWARERLPEPRTAIERPERVRRPLGPERPLVAEGPLETERPLVTARPLRTERPLEVLDPRGLFAVVETAASESSESRLARLSRMVFWTAATAGVLAFAVIIALPVAGLTPKVRPYLTASAAPAATLADVAAPPERDVPATVLKVPVTPRTPLLSWPAVPGARRYWVHLAIVGPRAETVVLAVPTEEPRVQVPETWSEAGHRRRLVPGVYRWYVWPDDGTNAVRYGAPVARGAFDVP